MCVTGGLRPCQCVPTTSKRRIDFRVNESISALRPFQCDPWARRGHGMEEFPIQLLSFRLQAPGANFNACGNQALNTFAGNFRVGIFGCDDDSTDAPLDQEVGTGWRLSSVAAGFQCDICAGQVSFWANLAQSIDLGMSLTKGSVPTFSRLFLR